MSGPIVRTGPSLQYSENWDAIFGKKTAKKTAKKKKKAAGKATARKAQAKKK
jgi:hypothetical protein